MSLLVVGQYDRRPLGSHTWAKEGALMRIEDRLRKSVVWIGLKGDLGFIAVGTALLLNVQHEGHDFTHLVTARHNLDRIDKSKDIYVRVNTRDGSSEEVEVPRNRWKTHPKDKPYVDIAVTPVGGLKVHKPLDVSPLDFPSFELTKDLIEKYDIGVGDPVVTIGLFARHPGEAANLPVARIGNIALWRDSSVPVPTSHGYMDAHLVELRSIGGLSGSPVYVQLAPFRVIGKTITPMNGTPPQYLLGIMQGHYAVEDAGDITDQIESADLMNSGVGVVIPMDKVIEVINHPELVAMREEIVKKMRKDSGHIDDSAPVPFVAPNKEPEAEQDHREAFNRLVAAASKSKPKDDRT